VLNEELVVDAFEVVGLGIAGDTKGLLAGIDVLEVGGKVEAKMHKVMEGKHVVVRYAEEVAYGEVASDEVVAGSVQAVVDSVLAMHDAVMGDAVMHDEAIGDVQAKVNVVVAESQDNAEDVQVRDAEVQVNETLSIPLAIIFIIDFDNVEEGVTYQVIKTKSDKIAIRDKSETVVEQ
jgi:hypothetical protein